MNETLQVPQLLRFRFIQSKLEIFAGSFMSKKIPSVCLFLAFFFANAQRKQAVSFRNTPEFRTAVCVTPRKM